MENTEKKIEQINNFAEKERIREQSQEAQNAAELRRGKIEKQLNVELAKSSEEKAFSKSHTANEAANLRLKPNSEVQHDRDKLAQLEIDRLVAKFDKGERSQREKLEQMEIDRLATEFEKRKSGQHDGA